VISPESAQSMVDKMTKANRDLRKQLYDIVLYSEGAFRVDELYQMPLSQLSEIMDAFTEKREKEKEAIDAMQSKNTRKF
jgi:hypothetical protein